MLKEHAAMFRRVMIMADALVAGASFFIAYYVLGSVEYLYSLDIYLWIVPVIMLTWGILLYFGGMYASVRMKSVLELLGIILRAGFFGLLVFGSMLYLFRFVHISRALVLCMFGLTTYLLILEKLILIIVFRHLRVLGRNFRNILVVGTGSRAQRFIYEVDQHREFGLQIAGLIDERHNGYPYEVAGHPVLGSLKDIPAIINDKAVDSVVFIVPRSWLARIEEPILYCETVGVSASIAVDFFELEYSLARESRLFGFPLLTFERNQHVLWHLFLKRVIDVVLSGLALIILAPFLALVAILIKMTDAGPVFFSQIRSGLNGRPFHVYKFRTMVTDAEAQLEKYRHLNEMQGPVFKIGNDPRITWLGRYLRKLSIDELPQLWNVFKGDMSLVGPRPPLPTEVAKYDSWQRRRLSMRPGITCIWQISGRNTIVDFNRWMKLDLYYIDHWSLWKDFVILFKTIPAVLITKGAK